MLKKIIAKGRQLWVRYVERKLTKVATMWKAEEETSVKPSKKETKNLRGARLTEPVLKAQIEIRGTISVATLDQYRGEVRAKS